MKLIKTIERSFATIKYYDLGKTTSKFGGGFDRKIEVIQTLDTGQESMCRYRGTWSVDFDGDVRIELSPKAYSTKCKGFDY
tara:strand:- start:651 stop:893 length:243 start_codon:yes stop_codon:yes gene_type:complete